ncbi:hypothetical protein K3722_14790 [Leisingera caerulea]|jgi:hypothetical protein|uniref:Uncharacterized protein n=1 Tax=Leisingera caerulea TaxID=506591 RepID=A0ABY5WU33_LEICA|nr:hypothetical protein [Leisingera caerulea]UWQ57762.1 hypothetical protein K3722_14790 [Leisingera caerulea]
MLRALAARRSAALPNFFLCMAEENAAITASRGKFETSNSRVADFAAIDRTSGVRETPFVNEQAEISPPA